MPKKPLPRIQAVQAGEKPFTLLIEWQPGQAAVPSLVDVSSLISTFTVYAPLKSTDLFRSVQVGEYGTDVVWSDDLEMSADTLWRLAKEQSGVTMSATDFKHWRQRRNYTLDQAAEALGLSRRMVAYYDQGIKPIPRVVALAAVALDYDPNPRFQTG
jgi:hypothetical protein